MHYFSYRRGYLYCENVKVSTLGEEFGTPLYIYSARTILVHYQKLKKAFRKFAPLICYSVKANSNISILKLLVDKGAGLDIVSGGELYRAKLVNCPPKKIVYASVGKTDTEIREAIKYGILMFNAESLPELERIEEVSRILNTKVDVSLRINPEVVPSTHDYIVTGKEETKFGMDFFTAGKILSSLEKYPHINIVGIHIHIGSQITHARPFIIAIRKVKNFLKNVSHKGFRYLNIGGGLGIVYDREKVQTVEEFVNKISPLLKNIPFRLIIEPGRFIVGNAGILLTKVLYVKDVPHKRFIVVDAAMNDLIRPSLYQAYHRIVPTTLKSYKGKSIKSADIVGPICESGDFLGKNRRLSVIAGEYLAVLGAGAYGFSMSSNYNSRPRPAEVLVKGNKVYLIRERENYQDLVAKEILI